MLLETERLRIRDYRATDLADFYEIFSDAETMRFIEPPYDRARCERWLRYFADNPAVAYAVEEKQSGRVIGHALFKQLPGEATGVYEIGWIYNRRFWGRGYAREASSALIGYGFDALSLHKICAETLDAQKSVALMRALGMTREGVFRAHTRDSDGNWADVYWYAILESDHRRAAQADAETNGGAR